MLESKEIAYNVSDVCRYLLYNTAILINEFFHRTQRDISITENEPGGHIDDVSNTTRMAATQCIVGNEPNVVRACSGNVLFGVK